MDFVVVLDKILIPEDEHENEYEKNQIRSHMRKPCAFYHFISRLKAAPTI